MVKENKDGRGRRENEIWSRPEGGRLKVNCDDSFDVGLYEVGTWVVVRDCNGRAVEGCNRKFVCESPLAAEAMTLRDGLNLVVEKGWQNVLFEIDSKYYIPW